MKLNFLALALVAVTGMAAAQDHGALQGAQAATQDQAIQPVYVNDPVTNQKRELSFNDAKNPEVLLGLLPRLDGVPEIYNLYLEKGYAPFHAYILTNADVINALKAVSPNLPLNENVEQKIDGIRNLYQPQ